MNIFSLDSTTDCAIHIADEAAVAGRHGAEELRTFIHEMTGIELDIVDDAARLDAARNRILVGDSRHLREICPEPLNGIGPDGYRIRADGSRLAIWGAEPRGTLNGIYAFLHELGCRWYTRKMSLIPRRERIEVGSRDESFTPPISYRNFILDGVMSPDWCARNHVNGFSSEVGPKHGGRITHWQFGHSFDSLVPPEELRDSHPEYFALVRGQRILEETQLCCTHPEVIQLLTDRLRRQIESDLAAETQDSPSPDVYYLAQNDWGNCCECPSCRALTEREESDAAPVIHLCNKVVEKLDLEFPDKSFMTISYRFTAKPPKQLRAHPKLIVQVCPIECCFAHPFSTCDFSENVRFRHYMEGWQRTASRLWVWDYATHLRNPLVPTPGLPPLSENLRWFLRHGVTGYFYQDVGNRQFNELRGWLISRLLWRPDDDPERLSNEFLEAFYGAAAGPIQSYLHLIRDQVDHENVHVFYSDTPAPAYLTDQILKKSLTLWDEAEDAVHDDAEFLGRVRKEREHTRLACVERESRKAVVHNCRLKSGRHVTEKPTALREESRAVLQWARDVGADKLCMLSHEQFEGLIDSEIVTLENGLMRLTFAPRLGPRLLNLELLSSSDEEDGSDRSLLLLMDSNHPDFPGDAGYYERWLAAPEEPDPIASFVAGWAEGGLGLGSYAYYTKPMYHWWHANLEEGRRVVAVGVRVLNRSNTAQDAAIECNWPLNLGSPEDVEIFVPETKEKSSGSESLEFSADQADGLRLHNNKEGLGVTLVLGSQDWESVTTCPLGSEGIRLTLRTRSELIIPAAWRSHLHKLEVEQS